jgi:DNA-binding CsgD family transcriptional regulator
VDPRSRITWWVVVVRAEIAQGRLDRAEQYAARAEALARRVGLAGHRGNALLARAYVHLARGDPAGLDSALAAAEAFAAAGCPLDEGHAYFTAATVLDGPSAYATRARVLFEACGAHALARRASRLEASGARTGLTYREAQTAELVAEGITNREIARRLGISEKTVEKYVSSLLAKLGVAGRAAIAALVGSGRALQLSQVTRPSGPTTTRSPASS